MDVIKLLVCRIVCVLLSIVVFAFVLGLNYVFNLTMYQEVASAANAVKEDEKARVIAANVELSRVAAEEAEKARQVGFFIV